MINCAKCKVDFALVATVGNTKTYRCNCPREIVESTGQPGSGDLEARVAALEGKVSVLEKP